MNYLATKFQMQPHEEVTVNKGIVFCGYEIDKEENGDFVQKKRSKTSTRTSSAEGGGRIG